MGHRAIVLYETGAGSGLFNAHYSHWGAAGLELAAKLSRDNPWGGDKSEPEGFTQLISMLTEAAGDDMGIGGYAAEATKTTEVEPEPIARNVRIEEAFEEVVDAVHHEAVFVVVPDRETEEFDVTAFRPVSISLPGEPHRESDDIEYLAFNPRWVGDEPVSDANRRGIASGMKKTLGALAGKNGAVTVDDVEDLWPDLDGGLTAEMDVGDIVQVARKSESTGDSLFTYPAARRILVRLFVADFEDSLSEYISPYSTAASRELWREYPDAFLELSGRTRVLGDMYPTGFTAPPHLYPDDFPFPQKA